MYKMILNKYNAMPLQVKAAFWFFACSVLQKGIATITTPIFTRLLTPEEYGSYSIFNSWLGIISVFVTVALTQGASYMGLYKFNEKRNSFLSSMQGLTLTMAALWTCIYFLFHNYWNRLFSLNTVQMISMLVIVWTTAVFEIWAGEQRTKFNYKYLVLLSVSMAVAVPATGIFFILHSDDKVTARIFSIALVQVIGYSGLFIRHMLKGKKFCDSYFWKYALLYSFPLIPQALAETVLNSSDRIMISRMIGDSEAGIYSLAYTLSLIMMIVSTAITQTMSPWIYQRLKNRNIDGIAPVATFSLMLVAGVNLMLIAVAPEVLKMFAPANYYEAVWVIPPICMSAVGMFLCNLFAKLEFYYEKTYYVMIGSLIAAIANIVLNYIFIRRYGYFAAGYTTLVCFLLDASCHYVFMRVICKKYLNGKGIYEIKPILAIIAGFLTLGFILMLLYSHVIIRYIVISVACLIVLFNMKKIGGRVKLLLLLKKEGL